MGVKHQVAIARQLTSSAGFRKLCRLLKSLRGGAEKLRLFRWLDDAPRGCCRRSGMVQRRVSQMGVTFQICQMGWLIGRESASTGFIPLDLLVKWLPWRNGPLSWSARRVPAARPIRVVLLAIFIH